MRNKQQASFTALNEYHYIIVALLPCFAPFLSILIRFLHSELRSQPVLPSPRPIIPVWLVVCAVTYKPDDIIRPLAESCNTKVSSHTGLVAQSSKMVSENRLLYGLKLPATMVTSGGAPIPA